MALERTRAERRATAHAMALVAAAVVEFHGASDDAARAAACRAIDYATASGLGEYHGIAPAVAIRAVTDPSGTAAMVDADHAVALARRAATMLGLVFALTLAGDVLLHGGDQRGRELLDEALRLIDRCPDPGIARPLLDRATARHRVARSPSARRGPGGTAVRARTRRAPLPAVHTFASRDRP